MALSGCFETIKTAIARSTLKILPYEQWESSIRNNRLKANTTLYRCANCVNFYHSRTDVYNLGAMITKEIEENAKRHQCLRAKGFININKTETQLINDLFHLLLQYSLTQEPGFVRSVRNHLLTDVVLARVSG